MINNEEEIWKLLPSVPGVEVSTLGNVRILDRLVSSEKYTRFTQGRILKQYDNGNGYLIANIPVDGKWAPKKVHRLVAQTFILNPNGFPMVNHKDCNRRNNNVKNLEWCDNSYNMQYREKYGVSQTEAVGHPLFAVNLSTLEVSHFCSQLEAGLVLGVSTGNINGVIKGRLKQAHGYWFKEDDGNGIEINKDKLNDITDGMHLRQCVFAVNLNTLEVSRFKSQCEAGRELGINQSNINSVIKGKRKQASGYWLVNDDEKAADAIKQKLHEIKD